MIKGSRTYPVHVLGPGFGCKHGQDPSAAPYVQHNFVLEDVLVVVHGVPVGERPHLVLQHLLDFNRGRQNTNNMITANPCSGSLLEIDLDATVRVEYGLCVDHGMVSLI